MKDRGIFYELLIFCVVVLTMVFFIKSSREYNELLEVCDTKSANFVKAQIKYEEDISNRDSLNSILEQNNTILQSENTTLKEDNTRLKKKLNKVELKEYDYTKEEILLLARCVEAEAGYSDKHGNAQKYIAQVILNRVASENFPNTIEKVIYQKTESGVPQFSVAYNGTIEREVEKETLLNVYEVIVNGTDLPNYVTYFYSASVKENWVNTLPIYCSVEGTVFAYESKDDY